MNPSKIFSRIIKTDLVAWRQLQFIQQEDKERAPHGDEKLSRSLLRKNKESRILNNASAVNNFFIMPVGWDSLFPSFYNEVTNYMAVGANATDDGPDDLTGIYEHEMIRAEQGYKRKN